MSKKDIEKITNNKLQIGCTSLIFAPRGCVPCVTQGSSQQPAHRSCRNTSRQLDRVENYTTHKMHSLVCYKCQGEARRRDSPPDSDLKDPQHQRLQLGENGTCRYIKNST